MIAACKGKKGEQEYQNSHASDPVSEASPENNAFRKDFHIRKNAGTGGCEAGYGFKDGVDGMGNTSAYNEGQRPGNTENDPAQSNCDTSVLDIEYFVGRSLPGKKNAHRKTDQDGNQKIIDFLFLINKRCDTGKHHKYGLQVEHPSCDIKNNPIIHFLYLTSQGYHRYPGVLCALLR